MFDNTCGLYAVMNAVDLLFDKEVAHSLFTPLVSRLDAALCRQLLSEGSDYDELQTIARAAEQVLEEHGVGLAIFDSTGARSIANRKDSIFNHINELMNDVMDAIRQRERGKHVECVCIIAIEYPNGGGHWTCVQSATKRQLVVYDSSDRPYKHLRMANYGNSGWKISNDEVLFLCSY